MYGSGRERHESVVHRFIQLEVFQDLHFVRYRVIYLNQYTLPG